MAEDKKTLSALRAGESGEGKSELGSQLINIDLMSLEKMKELELLDVNEIFSGKEDFYDYPGQTKWAIRDRLQSDILGFNSDWGHYVICWDEVVFRRVKERLSKISEEFDWNQYLGSEDAATVIQGLFEKFAGLSRKCRRNPSQNMTNWPVGGDCPSCLQKDMCIQNILYEEKKDIIHSEIHSNYELVSKWLAEVYDFSSCSNEAKAQLQNVFNDLYVNAFILLCREHNAKSLAEKIKDDCVTEEILKQIDGYFNKYDRKLDEDGRKEFQKQVLAQING